MAKLSYYSFKHSSSATCCSNPAHTIQRSTFDTVYTRVIIIGSTLRWINSTWTKREMKKKKEKRVHFVVYFNCFENIYLNVRFEHLLQLLWHCWQSASDAGYDMATHDRKWNRIKKKYLYKFVLLSLRQCHPSRKRYIQYTTCTTTQKLVDYGCRSISFHFVWKMCAFDWITIQ